MKNEKGWTFGKHALITGASGGLGMEISRYLAGRCRKLTLVARNKEKLRKMRKELNASQTEIDIYPMDICDIEEMRNLIYKIYEMESDQIDIFVNCAGGSHVIEQFERMSHSDIEQIFDTNAKAPLFWLRELLPQMKNHGIEPGNLKRGHIMMLSSRSAERALPRLSVYAAAKGTVEKMIEAMQREYAQYRLVFTLVAPGSINTSFTVNWSQKDRDEHNAEAMNVEEAVLPILQALDAQYATNKISYESTTQWLNELGVSKLVRKREKTLVPDLRALRP